MSGEELLEATLEILNFDIEDLEQRRDWHLRAPWDGRMCNQALWHKALYRMNEKLTNLRLERAELLVERGREQ